MASSSTEEAVLIVGVGLIGGSLAAALRARKLARRVVGLGRNPQRLQGAMDAGLLDSYVTSPAAVPADTSLVVVCTPVSHIVDDVQGLIGALPPHALVTDAGSTKARICEQLSDLAAHQPSFIGSHPIAGSEKQGFEHADPALFAGRTCIITPLKAHRQETIERVERLWQGVGMQTQRLSPAEHDRALARTSHVPHVVAAALAATLQPADIPWTGTGFRDSTRIASGDPELWTAILRENSSEVLSGLAGVRERLDRYIAALAAGNAAAVTSQLRAAKDLRDQLTDREDE